jgi:hypothetical protein
MATTTSTDVKIYHPQMVGAFIETIQQNVDAFNAASQGALQFQTRELRGQYEYESFFDEVSNISRRDPAAESSSTAAATKLTQDEFIGVKLNRRNGPYEWNISAARLAGFDPGRFSVAVGEQTAVATPQEMLDRALGALGAKLIDTAALKHDRTGGDLRLVDLVDAVAKFGDRASRIAVWVMHSKPFFDLVKGQVTSSESVYSSDIFGATLFQGTPATLGRPVLVTDSASLVDFESVSTGSPNYSTLGLTRAAAEIDVTEPPIAVAEGPITGSDNLFIRWQAEYSYNLKLRGCRYNTSTGVNPTDANVATAASWVSAVSDNKLLPGVIVESK